MTERMMDFCRNTLEKLLPLTSRARNAVILGPPEAPAIPDTPDKLTQELNVMSFNVLTRTVGEYGVRRRYDGVLKTILNELPDTVGLQEAHELWRGPLKKDLSGRYGVACDKGRVFGFHEGTPIYYRKDKFDLVKEGVFWLSQRPEVASIGWDAVCPRIAGWAVLRDKKTGFTWAHFNTHLDHKGPAAKANGARLVAERINALGLPAVLTGDLNSKPGSRPMEYLAAGGLTDLRDAAEDSDTGLTHHGYRDCTGVIDYVLANHYLRKAAQFKVIRDEYDGIYPSDHFAVAARFTMAMK